MSVRVPGSRRLRAAVAAGLAFGTAAITRVCLAQSAPIPVASAGAHVDSTGVTTDASHGATRSEPDELIYSVNRLPESVFQTGRAVSVVSGADLRRRGARTLPEALMEEVGVFVQQTAYGHGAPIIRGLIGKQILIMINGVRLNNATFRSGPNQYLATIDLETVDRVEIVRGVGSVLGSDALGGSINVVTRTGLPQETEPALRGRLSTRVSSADRSRSLHGEVLGRARSSRFLVGATSQASGDVTGGADVGRQRSTGYGVHAGNVYVERFFGTRVLSAAMQILEQHDVPRTDRIGSGSHLRYVYDPQRMQVASLRFEDQTSYGWADAVQLTAFWNRQDEAREEVLAASSGTMRRLSDSDVLAGATAEAALFVGAHRLVYGADVSRERIRSRRTDVDLATGAGTAKRGLYTDRATYLTAALYLQDRFDLARWITTTLGVRYSGSRSAGAETTSVGMLDLKGRAAALTGSASLVFHARDWLNIVANATSGFRAPNLDDISAFEIRGEGTEVPNPRARPEHIDTYEIGFKYRSESLSASAFYFDSELSGLLVPTTGTFGGLGYIDANGNGQRDAGESAVLQKQNMGAAEIHGSEAAVRYFPVSSFSLSGNATYTSGDNAEENDAPLSRIPPLFGAAAARWAPDATARPWAEVAFVFAGSQRRLSAEDLRDTRIGPGGTDGWRTLMLRGGAQPLPRLRVVAALENVFDRKYKYHGSGVFRPGRQVVMNVEYTF